MQIAWSGVLRPAHVPIFPDLAPAAVHGLSGDRSGRTRPRLLRRRPHRGHEPGRRGERLKLDLLAHGAETSRDFPPASNLARARPTTPSLSKRSRRSPTFALSERWLRPLCPQLFARFSSSARDVAEKRRSRATRVRAAQRGAHSPRNRKSAPTSIASGVGIRRPGSPFSSAKPLTKRHDSSAVAVTPARARRFARQSHSRHESTRRRKLEPGGQLRCWEPRKSCPPASPTTLSRSTPGSSPMTSSSTALQPRLLAQTSHSPGRPTCGLQPSVTRNPCGGAPSGWM